jgi:tetratricopeptide (TPR) repeat protein
MSAGARWRCAVTVTIGALALVPATATRAPAQPRPGTDPAVPAEAGDDDGQEASPLVPAMPVVSTGDAIADLPAVLPDRFAVMAFENHTAHDSLDYLVAGAPFALAEKVEDAIGLVPAYGPLVVSPPLVPGMAKTVAPFAAERDATWVFTGWFERPSWQLRIVVELWKIEGGVATEVGQAERTGPFEQLHQFLGQIIEELAPIGGWRITDAGKIALAYQPSVDLYPFTLFGRGLGHLVGVLDGGTPNPKAALHDLERATFIDPKLVEAQRVLGEVLATQPEPRAAVRAAGKFSYAIDLRPAYAPGLRAAADAARAAGKDEIALDLYRRLIARRPWDLDARFRLGEALWKTGDPKRAVIELERVAGRRPDDLATRRVLALIHAERGETEALVAELEEIAARAPADLDVKLDLAAAYAALARWEPALAAYTAVATARPGDVGLAKRIGDVERWRGDTKAADDWYRRARELAPDDPRAYFAAAASYLERGDLAEALRTLNAAQRFKEYLGATYHALGVVQLRLGDASEAVWYLRRAARLQPRRRSTRVGVIAAELIRRDKLAAERQLAFALAAWPDDADLAYLAGALASLRDDPREARALVAKALALDPKHIPAKTALSTLDLGGEIEVSLVPSIDLPFGDARELANAIDRFGGVDGSLAVMRSEIQQLSLQILTRFGEGPMKKKPPKGQRSSRRGSCPIADVVRPWRAAETALAAYNRIGVELDDLHRYLARHDALGDGANLLPDQRARLVAARKAYVLALADVREQRAMWTTAIGRELKAHRCRPALLAAAARNPERYTLRNPPKVVVATQTRKPREPHRETFFVDNRDCSEPLVVYVDGEEAGNVPGGERSALSADAGQRTVCLIGKGNAACGDRGTVRQAYLHDGWEVVMKCPK